MGEILIQFAKNIEETLETVRVKSKDKERAEYLAVSLNDTIVINGNGLDEEVLAEATDSQKLCLLWPMMMRIILWWVYWWCAFVKIKKKLMIKEPCWLMSVILFTIFLKLMI